MLNLISNRSINIEHLIEKMLLKIRMKGHFSHFEDEILVKILSPFTTKFDNYRINNEPLINIARVKNRSNESDILESVSGSGNCDSKFIEAASWLTNSKSNKSVSFEMDKNIDIICSWTNTAPTASIGWKWHFWSKLQLLKTFHFIVVTFICVTTLFLPTRTDAAYIATELVTMHEGSVTTLRGINNSGYVVGGGWKQGRHKGFILKGKNIKENINGPSDNDFHATNGINDKGQVVGTTNTDNSTRAFRQDRLTGTSTNLNPLPGDNGSVAMAINQQGDAAGYSSGEKGVRAVFWKKTGKPKALPGLYEYDGFSSRGLATNSLGDVVGISEIPPGPRAVLWSKGVAQDLGVLAGDRTSEALAINNKGFIVGSSGVPNKETHAVLWVKNNDSLKIQNLGFLPGGGSSSRAVAINDDGVVVGTSDSNDGQRAFVWTAKDGMQDLNDLVVLRSGFVLTYAVAINNKGDIVAAGMDEANEGEMHKHDLKVRIFKLIPQP